MTRNQGILLGAGIGLVAVVSLLIFALPGSADPDSSDPEERLDAAEALAGKSDEAALETLHRLANDSNARVARVAVRAMAQAKEPANQQAILRVVQECKSPAVRGEAAAALGEFEAVPVGRLTSLLGASGQNNAALRAGAAKGLAKRRDPAAVWSLFERLSDPDPKVRAWAITAISKTTCQRYIYDARQSPETQRERIAEIGRKLRERLPR